MKTPFLISALMLASSYAQAQPADDPALDKGITALQNGWAQAKYQMADHDVETARLTHLEDEAAALAEQFPNRAEPKVWQGILLSTDAGITGGLSALGKVKKAKKLLEESLALDDTALNGSAHGSLGTLYYMVPRWPLAFGDNAKAEDELKKALAIAPDSIDNNFFYGDFLMRQGRLDEAKAAFLKAKAAAPRPGRELADSGRRQEIEAALAKLAAK